MNKIVFSLLLLFSCMGVTAQTTTYLVTDEETGLEYLRDGKDGELYITLAHEGGDFTQTVKLTDETTKDIKRATYFIENFGLRYGIIANSGISPIEPGSKLYKITKTELTKTVTSIKIINSANLFNKDAGGCKGIEYFKALTTLTITNSTNNSGNVTSPLDLSKNDKLEKVEITGCQNLTELKLPATETLTDINLENSGITSLDVTNNTSLKSLNIRNSAVGGKLDLSKCTELTSLTIHNVITRENAFLSDASKYKYYLQKDVVGENEYHYYYETYHPAEFRSYIEELDISNTKLSKLLFVDENRGSEFEICKLRKLTAKNCTELTAIHCQSSFLEYMDVTGCTKLKTISMPQGKLKEITGIGDCKETLEKFIIMRHQWEDMSFFNDKGPWEKLTHYLVNGATYKYNNLKADDGTLLKNGNNGIIVREDNETSNPIIYTTKIKSVDLTKTPNVTQLMIADNLMTQLKLSDLTDQTTMKMLQLSNNMFLTLDLSGLDSETTTSNCTWSNQAVFSDMTIIKGDAADGSKDRVGLLLPNGHGKHLTGEDNKLDNNMRMYDNLDDALNPSVEGTDIGKAYVLTHNDGNDYLIIHEGKGTDSSGDCDVYSKVITYEYNTGFNNGEDIKGIKAKMDVRVHIYPYIMYINPLTKSGTGVNYYSGTICLGYDAIVPEGVECYIITGVKDIKKITTSGNAEVETQLNMVKVGSPGDIMPAGTPLYVRTIVDENGETTAAGLYAFQKNWDFEYLGWENYKGNTIEDVILHKSAPNLKCTAKDISGYGTNILRANSTKLDEMTEEGRWYRFSDKAGVKAKSLLVLGREKRSGMIGFWPTSGGTIPAHRCWIDPDDLGIDSSSAAKGFSFHFEDDSTTGIISAKNESAEPQDDAWYTTLGTKTNGKPSQKGIYIHNGNKVVVQ